MDDGAIVPPEAAVQHYTHPLLQKIREE